MLHSLLLLLFHWFWVLNQENPVGWCYALCSPCGFFSNTRFDLFFFFLQSHLWHIEVPGLGVILELQLKVYATALAAPDPRRTCDLRSSVWQCWFPSPPSYLSSSLQFYPSPSYSKLHWDKREVELIEIISHAEKKKLDTQTYVLYTSIYAKF